MLWEQLRRTNINDPHQIQAKHIKVSWQLLEPQKEHDQQDIDNSLLISGQFIAHDCRWQGLVSSIAPGPEFGLSHCRWYHPNRPRPLHTTPKSPLMKQFGLCRWRFQGPSKKNPWLIGVLASNARQMLGSCASARVLDTPRCYA